MDFRLRSVLKAGLPSLARRHMEGVKVDIKKTLHVWVVSTEGTRLNRRLPEDLNREKANGFRLGAAPDHLT